MLAVPNLLPPMNPAISAKWRDLLNIFTDEQDRPYGGILTPTQIQIIDIIGKRRFPRTQLILPTQYGKSLAVALGVLMRVAHHNEKWAIVAPTEDKARIIMDYIIDHIFDDELFTEKLEYYGSKEQLKRERSKTRITFRGAGEVRVYTGNAGNSTQVRKALMGFGAPNVILDESAAIPDELYATVKRMVGGSKDNFLLEIGNPSMNNHFRRTWFGERYVKIFLDVYMALAEGRYTPEYVDEMREEIGFEWMYECLFPDEDAISPKGYRRLLNDMTIEAGLVDVWPDWQYRMNENERLQNRWGFDIIDDQPLLGIDPAAGGANKCKFVIRFPRYDFSFVAATSDSDDLEELADIGEKLIKQWNIEDYRTVIDAGGVGHGLPAIFARRGYLVIAVLFGENDIKSLDTVVFKIPRAFLNVRAYMYWELRKWVRASGKMLRDAGFLELKLINYRQNATLKLQIEPKEEMIKRKASEGERVLSPDTADALALTFIDTGTITSESDIDFD